MSVVVWLTILAALILVVANAGAIRWPWWSSVHHVVALLSAEAFVAIVAMCFGAIWLDGWAVVLCGLVALIIPIIACGLVLLASFLLFPPIRERDIEPLEVLSSINSERKENG